MQVESRAASHACMVNPGSSTRYVIFFMIFRLEAVPESIVRRYFLQVPALLNLRFPGSHMPVCSTGVRQMPRFACRKLNSDFVVMLGTSVSRILDSSLHSCFRYLIAYCPFAHKWQVVFVDPLPSKMRTEGNFQARFSRRNSIQFPKLYRATSSFFALRKYFNTHF